MSIKLHGLRRGFLGLAVTLAIFTGASRLACAQLVSDESFNYATGPLVTTDKPGTANGFSTSAAWSTGATVDSGSLSYPASSSLTSSGNSLGVTNSLITLAGSNNNTLGGGAYNSSFDFAMSGSNAGQTLYASYLVDPLATASSNGFAQLDLSGAGHSDWVIGIGSGGSFLLKTSANDSTSVAVTSGTTLATIGTTYLLVSKIVTQSSGVDTVYLNYYAPGDTVPTTEPTTWMLSETVTSTGTAIATGLTYQVGANASDDIDEIKLGDSFASVTSVPEPPAVAYILLSVLFLAGARWYGLGLRNESSNVI